MGLKKDTHIDNGEKTYPWPCGLHEDKSERALYFMRAPRCTHPQRICYLSQSRGRRGNVGASSCTARHVSPYRPPRRTEQASGRTAIHTVSSAV